MGRNDGKKLEKRSERMEGGENYEGGGVKVIGEG